MKSKFWFLVIILFAVSFFGFDGNKVNIVDKSNENVYGTDIITESEGIEEYGILHCSFANLTSVEKEIYYKICEMTEKGQTEYELRNVEKDAVEKAYLAVFNDRPDYFWLGRGYSYTVKSYFYGSTVTLKPVMSATFYDVQSRRIKLENAVTEIINLCDGCENLYDKVILVHNYIIDNTNYDYEVANAITKLEMSKSVFDSSSAYGCLVNKSAVCSGYSAAFQLIMQRLGIPCGRITGAKNGGESHEWNYIVLDGDYYYVDVTWDDPQSTEVFIKLKNYEFFCITTEELLKTHTIDDDQFVPVCNAVKYDYYIYHNQYFNTYDFDGFREAVRESDENGVSVKFSSEEELKRAVNDLFKSQRIFYLLNQRHVSYSIGVSGLVLSIPFE